MLDDKTSLAVHPKERVELAAAYRLIGHFGLDDSIFTHISAKAPAEEGDHAFLINPYGYRFEEVTAGGLVSVDLDGNILNDPGKAGINKAGFVIHSAIHGARPDVACVLHTHTIAGVAISSLDEGLQPYNQWSAPFFNRIAYHDYEGIAVNLDERERLVADLGDLDVMILRNHGLLTCGRTVGEAFRRMMDLERACKAQIEIMKTQAKPCRLTDELAEFTAGQEEAWAEAHDAAGKPDAEWQAYLRLCHRVAPGFDQ
ncbi:class II aldolase/adducin family protein [Pseudooceanicola nanhaiensis]|uniref:class II aldolase/adducin family protein n=1 Tax=Pseudooceanicola nanhaiensis TaxID=375761 RepID=UPI001CD5E24B|nr:class II aldolase/adducin family protein [Pseudooceanicola nanhaiensis]MCA0920153.1 class II aldolase/adducin family protein [Pseudooceanicola nanhaiensis]